MGMFDDIRRSDVEETHAREEETKAAKAAARRARLEEVWAQAEQMGRDAAAVLHREGAIPTEPGYAKPDGWGDCQFVGFDLGAFWVDVDGRIMGTRQVATGSMTGNGSPGYRRVWAYLTIDDQGERRLFDFFEFNDHKVPTQRTVDYDEGIDTTLEQAVARRIRALLGA
ncbi:hypothetical protein GCM10025867_46530 (plasmid) [Frondihabitans sucicola]|uniref:Uncharacterized protein n=1 Tax=Frondihabitans sucicola TaxID=1268041 RepID=A0ABN6Y8B9_9MICO|nr:hypothetical protein [Frondihabitans sucicola]BDZ52412.1 hypothetical protein GCM10025867_46530 [Frondihabitans sucicola]